MSSVEINEILVNLSSSGFHFNRSSCQVKEISDSISSLKAESYLKMGEMREISNMRSINLTYSKLLTTIKKPTINSSSGLPGRVVLSYPQRIFFLMFVSGSGEVLVEQFRHSVKRNRAYQSIKISTKFDSPHNWKAMATRHKAENNFIVILWPATGRELNYFHRLAVSISLINVQIANVQKVISVFYDQCLYFSFIFIQKLQRCFLVWNFQRKRFVNVHSD